MGVVIGIVILGIVIWSYVRVLARKRYATRQSEVPDLNRFGEETPSSGSGTNRPVESEDVTRTGRGPPAEL